MRKITIGKASEAKKHSGDGPNIEVAFRLGEIVRKQFGNTFPVDIDAIIEGLGGQLKCTNNVRSPRYRGAIIKESDSPKKFLLFVGQDKSSFAKAHMLGHLIVHLKIYDQQSWAQLPTIFIDTIRPNYRIEECEADVFASALLAPKDEFIKVVNQFMALDGQCNFSEVAKYFGIDLFTAIHFAHLFDLTSNNEIFI